MHHTQQDAAAQLPKATQKALEEIGRAANAHIAVAGANLYDWTKANAKLVREAAEALAKHGLPKAEASEVVGYINGAPDPIEARERLLLSAARDEAHEAVEQRKAAAAAKTAYEKLPVGCRLLVNSVRRAPDLEGRIWMAEHYKWPVAEHNARVRELLVELGCERKDLDKHVLPPLASIDLSAAIGERLIAEEGDNAKAEKGDCEARAHIDDLVPCSVENDELTKDEAIWLHQDSGRGDRFRLMRYFRDRFAVVRHKETMRAYVLGNDGLWFELDHKRSDTSSGWLMTLIESAREHAKAEMPLKDKSQWKLGVKPYETSNLAAYMVQRITSGHTTICGYELARKTSAEMTDRNAHKLLPLAGGGAIDFDNDSRIVSPEVLATKHFVNFGWHIEGPRQIELAFYDLEQPLPITVAEKYWGPKGRFHPILLRAAAWVAGGIDKSIDSIMGKPNCGKTAAAEALKRAFPNAIEVLQAPTVMHQASTRFTPLQHHMATNLAVMVDEIDKLQINERLGHAISAGKLNELAAEDMSVELKGVDARVMRRQGTAVFIGNDWPSINVRGDGVQERMQWAYAIDERLPPMPKADRNLLMTPLATEWLRIAVLQAAKEAYAEGKDLWEVPSERKVDALKLIQSSISLEEKTLGELVQADKDGSVPVELMSDFLDQAYSGNPPKTSAIVKVLRKSFGNHVRRVATGERNDRGTRTYKWAGVSAVRTFATTPEG